MLVFEQLLEHMMEGFLMAGAGLSIFGIRLKYKKLFIIGIIYGIIVYIVRWFYISNEIPFGTHSFILVGSFILILKYIGKQNYISSVLAILISYLFLLWGEAVIAIPVIKLIIKDPSTIGTELGHYTIGGILTCTFLIVLFIICYIFNNTIISLNGLGKKEKNRG